MNRTLDMSAFCERIPAVKPMKSKNLNRRLKSIAINFFNFPIDLINLKLCSKKLATEKLDLPGGGAA